MRDALAALTMWQGESDARLCSISGSFGQNWCVELHGKNKHIYARENDVISIHKRVNNVPSVTSLELDPSMNGLNQLILAALDAWRE